LATRAGVASIALLATASVLLLVRGPADWSRTFALTWYGIFAVAVVMSAAALMLSLLHRRALARSRLPAVALALPALIAVGILVWFVVVVVPQIAH
jgi:hypothetical protein